MNRTIPVASFATCRHFYIYTHAPKYIIHLCSTTHNQACCLHAQIHNSHSWAFVSSLECLRSCLVSYLCCSQCSCVRISVFTSLCQQKNDTLQNVVHNTVWQWRYLVSYHAPILLYVAKANEWMCRVCVLYVNDRALVYSGVCHTFMYPYCVSPEWLV